MLFLLLCILKWGRSQQKRHYSTIATSTSLSTNTASSKVLRQVIQRILLREMMSAEAFACTNLPVFFSTSLKALSHMASV